MGLARSHHRGTYMKHDMRGPKYTLNLAAIRSYRLSPYSCLPACLGTDIDPPPSGEKCPGSLLHHADCRWLKLAVRRGTP